MFAPILESGSKDDSIESSVRFSSLPSTTDSLSSYFGDSSGKRLKRFRSQYRYNKTPSKSSKSSLSLPGSTSKSTNSGKGHFVMKRSLFIFFVYQKHQTLCQMRKFIENFWKKDKEIFPRKYMFGIGSTVEEIVSITSYTRYFGWWYCHEHVRCEHSYILKRPSFWIPNGRFWGEICGLLSKNRDRWGLCLEMFISCSSK